ncbi:hypothetical protein TRFO_39975 [Tritrichomonas foetus]|uniref:Protein kinase domain-containing protein n=1 Tax=Tritrichomonas foetus TaxID=1144522 RepID=A0A1J4J2Q9_9EUKA|nr:hypothetical protein TRFO_39975 [Tritrichomonas foetus]|eukprot:OHS93728.1 hypothetical protein TRFO_39975 [Tritrichomonas foetus]
MSIETFLIDIHDYVLKKKIGSGTFGEVITIINKLTKEEFAAKLYRTNLDQFSDQKIFCTEIGISSRLSHMAIMKLKGFSFQNFKDEPYPIIVFNLMKNGSIGDMIDSSSKGLVCKEWTSTKRFINVVGIALGMKYLHSNHIVHRNLKPNNILLDSSFYLKIADFACATEVNLLNQNQTIIGTPLYISPEVISESYLTEKIDVFAFSLVVFQILANVPSRELYLNANSPMKLMNRVNNGERPKLERLSSQAQREFVSKCWEQDAETRYSFNEIVEFLLNTISERKVGENEFINEDVNFEEIDSYISLFQ